MQITEKQCRKCEVVKPISDFSPDKRRNDWHQGQCKQCRRDQMEAYRRANPEKTREISRLSFARNRKKGSEYRLEWKRKNKDKVRGYALKAKYGITTEQLEAIKSAQRGCCPICDRPLPDRAHTDHCHTTGKVRGVLCGGCNLGLGHIEKPGFLDRAMAYIAKHQDGRQTVPRSGL